MALNLFMRVSFTTGRYHGEEWPPAPMRLFQALAAGAGAASDFLIRTAFLTIIQ